MANCKPCFEEGRGQVIAHYNGTPAGMTRTGKEIPPMCYHHRNKLALPAIAKAPPVNAGHDPNAPTVPAIVAPKVVTAKAIAPQVDRRSEVVMVEKVKCAHPECHTMIRASNKSGACTPHWYWATHGKQTPGKKVAGGGGSQGESPAKPKAQRKAAKPKPVRTNGHVARVNGNGAARTKTPADFGLMQIQVSEAALDRLWAKFSGPEKAKAAAAVIG